LLQHLCWVHDPALMEEHPGAVEDKPCECEIEDDREVDGLAKARTGAVVFERIQQMDEFGVVQLAKAPGLHLERLGRFGSGGRIWRDFQDGHTEVLALTLAGAFKFVPTSVLDRGANVKSEI